MSMMDMPHHDRALKEASRVLRPGGFLQFSILHPCFAPPYRKVLREPDGTVRAIEVARYFDCVEGELETWSFSSAAREVRENSKPFRVPRFHRTLSAWVDMIVQSGLAIEKIGEPSVNDEQLRRFPDLADTRVVPLSIIFRVRKPAT
jgi:ubiquinone/menaquinone biosynthesis C-methylase UbiE